MIEKYKAFVDSFMGISLDEAICTMKFLYNGSKSLNYMKFIIYAAPIILMLTFSSAYATSYANDDNNKFYKQNSLKNSYATDATKPYDPNENYKGNLNANPYDPDSTANPYGQYGSPYSQDSINNPYGKYGSPYSNKSATNPYATNAPKLYDSQGNYRGKLSSNPYDPDSTANPYGQYGSPYSPDSINNPYGAGNPYSSNPISIYGE